MEEYEKLIIEIIDFRNEDIVTESFTDPDAQTTELDI